MKIVKFTGELTYWNLEKIRNIIINPHVTQKIYVALFFTKDFLSIDTKYDLKLGGQRCCKIKNVLAHTILGQRAPEILRTHLDPRVYSKIQSNYNTTHWVIFLPQQDLLGQM